MPNLEYGDTLTKVKALLGLNKTESSAKLTVCFELAVEQILREFRSSIGKRLVRNIPVEFKAAVYGVSEEICWITLPDDVRTVEALYYGTTQINIMGPDEYLKWKKSDIQLTEPFIGFLQQQEDGTTIVELFPSSSSLNGGFVDLVYNVSGKDLSVFPERYRRVMMYGAAKEFLLFDTMKRDPAIHSKIKAEYEAAKGELTLDQVYMNGETVDRKTMEQQRWEDGFNDFGYAPSRDNR